MKCNLPLALPALLATCLAAQETAPPQGPVWLVVAGLRVDESGELPVIDPQVGAGATVTLTPRGGQPQRRPAAALERGGRTWFTADFAIPFDTTCDLALTFANGPTITLRDYRVASEWTKVPIFTFNSTDGTRSPAAVLRREVDPATRLGCYVWALWPGEAYQQLTGRQPAP